MQKEGQIQPLLGPIGGPSKAMLAKVFIPGTTVASAHAKAALLAGAEFPFISPHGTCGLQATLE
jgi:hypothetical protein